MGRERQPECSEVGKQFTHKLVRPVVLKGLPNTHPLLHKSAYPRPSTGAGQVGVGVGGGGGVSLESGTTTVSAGMCFIEVVVPGRPD